MRLLAKLIGRALIGAFVIRLILKRTGGQQGVEKMMVEVMPKVLDKAFEKLAPEKRREMLDHFRTTLAELEEKYGTRAEHGEEPTA